MNCLFVYHYLHVIVWSALLICAFKLVAFGRRWGAEVLVWGPNVIDAQR